MSWVDADSNIRISELPLLMENVRLPLISKGYLVQHVEPNALMRSNAHCEEIWNNILKILLGFQITSIFISGTGLLIEAMKYHLLEPEGKRIFQSPRIRPRCPPKVFLKNWFSFYDILWHPWLSQVLLVVGGQSPKAIRGVECYDFETERWSPVAEIPTGKARYPLLSISFLIAQSPFIFVFQIFALEYLLLMDVCMQFVDQMEFVAWKQPM